MLAAAVSGSFHRHMDAIGSAVQELMEHSVRILSPADPRVVAAQGEFLFVASDHVRSVRLVQDRHLDCIRAADFLWLVCPDGYVGQSASMEIGFAAGAAVPIYGTHQPSDLTLRQYVSVVRSIEEAVRVAAAHPRPRRAEGLLIDPRASIESAQRILQRMDNALARSTENEDFGREFYGDAALLGTLISLPTSIQ
jgi:hypothetical protein